MKEPKEENEFFIKIDDTTENFDFWINKRYIDGSIREKLRNSNALILPNEGFRDRDDICFPVGTTELFHFLDEQKTSEFVPEICYGDEDYKELALHSDLAVIGTFIATNVALPFLVNYLYDYYKTKYGGIFKKNVKLEIIEQDGDKLRKLSYEGTAEDFNKHIIKAFKKIKK